MPQWMKQEQIYQITSGRISIRHKEEPSSFFIIKMNYFGEAVSLHL